MSFVVEHIRRRIPLQAREAKPAPQRTPMTRRQIADAIAALKERIRRMRPPLNHRPGAFHEDKSELVREAIRLEDAIRRDRQLETDDETETCDGQARRR